MDEVDYSRFLYKPYSPEPPEKKKHKDFSEKKSGKKKVFTVIIVILLCFAILFVCVDFFSKGKIFDSIYSLIAKTQYSFYCVVRSYPTRDMAHAGALLAENGGGAGYLFSENGDFFVVFNIYSDKSDADSVSAKNLNSFVYTLSFSTSSTKLANLIDDFIREINSCLNQIDSGTFSDGTLSALKDNYLVLFSAVEPKNEKETSLVSFIVSCLNSISPGTTERTSLLFQTRHMICSVLFSSRDAFS